MNFRIEKKESFQIMGLSGYITDEEMASERILPHLWDNFLTNYNARFWNNGSPSYYDEAYTRIITEWFPASNYKRDESAQSLDVYPPGKIDENYIWEIWIPVLNK